VLGRADGSEDERAPREAWGKSIMPPELCFLLENPFINNLDK
jgi:hypothetical protein